MSMEKGFKASRDSIHEKSKTKLIGVALYFNAKRKKGWHLDLVFLYIYLFVFLLSIKNSLGR